MPWFGLLNIDKPQGISSRVAVDYVKRLVRPDRAGHAGTLDPLATGVLIVVVGGATRLIDAIHEHTKEYRARFRLGFTSDTDDVTGRVVPVPKPAAVTAADVRRLLDQFVGTIEQAPPQYSAVHVDGRRAYKRARSGQQVALPPRQVHVSRIELLDFEPGEIELEIECSSGTYVRSIGRDLGERLGTGAVMSALTRTRIGPHALEDAVSLDDLTPDSLPELLLPPETAVTHLPQYTAAADELADVRHGRPFACRTEPTPGAGESVAVFTPDGKLVCLARFDRSDGKLWPKRVFLADS